MLYLVLQEHNILNSKNNKTNDTTINCTMTWSRRTTNITSSNCNHYAYLGTICRTFLTKWNFCTLGDADIIYSNEPKHTQSQKENDLLFLNSFLGNKNVTYHLISFFIF